MRRVLQALKLFFKRLVSGAGGGYLCDDCRWDYGDACRRPERPNARSCPDYKKR
jgi:hypothetical protein